MISPHCFFGSRRDDADNPLQRNRIVTKVVVYTTKVPLLKLSTLVVQRPLYGTQNTSKGRGVRKSPNKLLGHPNTLGNITTCRVTRSSLPRAPCPASFSVSQPLCAISRLISFPHPPGMPPG